MKVLRLLSFVDRANERIGKGASFFVLAIMGVVIYDVLMRYFLTKPQSWAPEVSEFFFGALFILGGGYTLLKGGHVRMDAIYSHLSPKFKAILDLATSIFFFLSCGVLLWGGWLMGWHSFLLRETTSSAFAPPLFPMKLLLPVGAGLLILQGVAKFIRDLRVACAKGKANEH